MKENILKYVVFTIGGILLFIVIFGGDLIQVYSDIVDLTTPSSIYIGQINQISVEIKGAVHRPGVYKIYEGANLNDILTLAKLCDNADTSTLNLASKVKDGETYYVPYLVVDNNETSKDKIDYTNGSINNEVTSNKLNINKASLEELKQLNGIGEVKANKILNYISSNGKITSYEQLAQIVGGLSGTDLQSIKENTILE